MHHWHPAVDVSGRIAGDRFFCGGQLDAGLLAQDGESERCWLTCDAPSVEEQQAGADRRESFANPERPRG